MIDKIGTIIGKTLGYILSLLITFGLCFGVAYNFYKSFGIPYDNHMPWMIFFLVILYYWIRPSKKDQ